MSSTAPLTVMAGFAFTLFLAYLFSSKHHDALEPPLVPSSMPFIGHAWGMAIQKFDYLVSLSQDVSLPAFSIKLPGLKMYIVTTPELINAVQKQPRALAFPPLEAQFATALCRPSKQAQDILKTNLNGEDGPHGLFLEANQGMRSAMSPGADLDSLNRLTAIKVGAALDRVGATTPKPHRVGLEAWLRQVVADASMGSIYGPEHPFRDAQVADAFWTLSKELTPIVLGVAPWIFARKGLTARKILAAAFEGYFGSGGHETASQFARVRYETGASNAMTLDDIGRFEINAALAVLINTVPAAFWTLFYIYSHPDLLKQIREQVDACVAMTVGSRGTRRSLNVAILERRCALLASTFQEVLRCKSVGVSVRRVMYDTWLDGQYLLKERALVQIPSRVIHRDVHIWGADAHVFNPRRFLAGSLQQTPTGKLPGALCLRSFGGGKTLCPGRHLATTEVLALVGGLVARFDVEPAHGGSWAAPPATKTSLAAALEEPNTDIDIEISPRQDFTDAEWSIEWKPS